MKKITILALTFAMACSLQAAQYVWGFTGDGGEIYQAGTEDYLEVGTAFLFLGTVTASETSFDLSSATLITSGGYDSGNYAFGQTTTVGMPSSDLVNATGGQAYTLILVDKSGVSSLDGYEGNYYLATGTSIEASIPGATVTKYANLVNADVIAGDSWSTMAAVPEPTSGLLLLLGIAGLALKRKCA